MLTDLKLKDIDFIGKQISDLSDTPSSDGMTAADLKAYFDYMPKMMIALGSFNDLIDALTKLGVDNATVSLGDGSFKYIRLNTDGQLEVSNDGITYEVTASSGHIILDGNGKQMPQRSRLKFNGVEITDDGINTIITGIKGEKGDTGEKGEKGDTGDTGLTGPQGKTGKVLVPEVKNGIISWTLQDEPIVPTAQNIQGPQGVQGVQGAQGVQGERGPQGIQGPAGAQGIQGEPQRLGVVGVQGAQRRVDGHDQSGLHGVADALHGVVEAVDAHQPVVDVAFGAVQRHLHTVETGLIQPCAQLRRQPPAVGVQPGDEPLRRAHQLHQIIPQRRLAAGEGHLRDVAAAQRLQDGFPLFGG